MNIEAEKGESRLGLTLCAFVTQSCLSLQSEQPRGTRYRVRWAVTTASCCLWLDQCDALKLESSCPVDGELWEGAEALEQGRELK